MCPANPTPWMRANDSVRHEFMLSSCRAMQYTAQQQATGQGRWNLYPRVCHLSLHATGHKSVAHLIAHSLHSLHTSPAGLSLFFSADTPRWPCRGDGVSDTACCRAQRRVKTNPWARGSDTMVTVPQQHDSQHRPEPGWWVGRLKPDATEEIGEGAAAVSTSQMGH